MTNNRASSVRPAWATARYTPCWMWMLIFKLFKDNRICINSIEKPHVFSDNLMKGHTPVIIYESGDWLSNFSNWSIYDKLQFQNSYIRYTNCELYEGNTVYITGSFLLGSIYSILIIINRVLKTVNKERKFTLNLSIKGNQRMMFRIQNQLMVLVFCKIHISLWRITTGKTNIHKNHRKTTFSLLFFTVLAKEVNFVILLYFVICILQDTSIVTLFKLWIKSFKFNPSIFCWKPPIDFICVLIPGFVPCGDFFFYLLERGNSFWKAVIHQPQNTI